MEIYVMPICKFCGQDKKLCNAHIIPKSFVYAAKPEDKTEKLKVLNYNLKYPSFSRIGITDRNILCSQCDGEFGVYDNFAYNFLIKTNISQYLTAIEGVTISSINDIISIFGINNIISSFCINDIIKVTGCNIFIGVILTKC